MVAVLPNPNFDRIVVGVDGSTGSHRALQWSSGIAEITGAEILCVHAFEYVPMRGAESNEVLLAEARGELDGRWTSDLRDGAVRYRTILDTKDPRMLLNEVASESKADVIVVGSRGHSQVAELLLGSVASFLTHHAEVPVVVIPHDAELSLP